VVLLAAVLAHAVNLEGVARSEVVILLADFLFQLIDFLRKEFHRTTALSADHVVMAAAIVLVLVAGDAIVKGDFARQPAFGQQFEGTVHGGIADADVLLLYQPMQFVGGKMVASLEEGAEDGVALRRLLQAHAFEVLMEDSLGLADHLARDRGLVIDALLQHGLVERIKVPREVSRSKSAEVSAKGEICGVRISSAS